MCALGVPDSAELRDRAVDSGLHVKILDKLRLVSGEADWQPSDSDDDEIEEAKTEVTEAPSTDTAPKKRSGVGYTTGAGETWNVSHSQKNQKRKAEEI